MGLLDWLFGKKSTKKRAKKAPGVLPAATVQPAPPNDGLDEETLRVLVATVAAYVALTTGESDFSGYRITRVSQAWEMAGRQQQMQRRSS